eukprot:14012496-Ditylum_brightwellii.AAC.1
MPRRPDEEPGQEHTQRFYSPAEPVFVWDKDIEETPQSLGANEVLQDGGSGLDNIKCAIPPCDQVFH